jgi:alkylation response protein AidB-like acyl-CoA dehydrogenase
VIVPLDAPGVTRRRIEVSGVKASGNYRMTIVYMKLMIVTGSGMIEFDSVSIPSGNLIGVENAGFLMMMSNFNQERLVRLLSCAALRLSRVCAEDAYEHSILRETFGQKLISHALISAKITQFGIDIEPVFSLLEQLTFMVKNSRIRNKGDETIGGMTALLKVASMRTVERCVREAQQVMGGVGYSKRCRGGRVEQISRDVRMLVVGGGSEEIMISLALRQHLRDVENLAQKSLSRSSKL